MWRLAWPLMLSNLSIPLVGLVDTAVAGHLPGPAPLGAVAVGGTVFTFLYWGLGFLRMGTTALAAQALGRGEAAEARAVLRRALLLAGLLGAALLLLAGPVLALALWLAGPEPQVAALAEAYCRARLWGAPANLALYAAVGWLLAAQRPRATLGLLLLANGANAALDLVLVPGLGLGVTGLGAAAALADALGAAAALALLGRELAAPCARVLEPGAVARLLALSRDIFLRTLVLVGAFAFFTAQGARLGTVPLAANAVLMQLQTLSSYLLDGFAHATEVRAGRALGAGRRAGLRRVLGAAALLGGAGAATLALAYALAGPALVGLLSTDPAVRGEALARLPWAVLLPLASVWAYLLDGLSVGAGRGRAMRNAMALAGLSLLAAWWLLRPWGNAGLWAAFTLFMLARALWLGLAWAPALGGRR
ncbi:MAG: MATE family efflux transporter [Gammaproteobacteria bacterium]|nr:MAG: MATE family efflux transporter [Gammaproteobacteria bacterium]